MGEDTAGSEEAGRKYLAEVTRVLDPEAGVFICVTLGQPHVLSTHFPTTSVAFLVFCKGCEFRRRLQPSSLKVPVQCWVLSGVAFCWLKEN